MKKMRNKIFGIVFILLVSSISFNFKTDANIVNYDPCEINNWTFTGGEELTYKIYYNWNFMWLPAGEAVFKVTDEGDQYHISVKGRTYSSYEWFFKVRDNYDTYINKKTLLPSVAIRDVDEGSYKLYEKLVFNQTDELVTSYRGDSPKDLNIKQYKLSECMHDLISVLYHTRNYQYEKFSKGQEFPVKIFMDKAIWPLSVKYKGRYTNLTVKGSGKYKAFKFSPEVISGTVFKKGTEMDVWVSDDNNRIPLYIESPVSVGSVKIVLKDYKGLKYPLSSKL